MMKRGHTVEEYKQKIRRLKEVRPDLSMSSDFIVGFPNETEADFEATMALINEIEFDHSFSFIYSARPGTPAAAFIDSVPEDEKKRRLNIMQSRLRELEDQHAQAMVGTTQRILVEREALRGEGDMAGRTENNRVVNFVGSADLIGQFVDVQIVEAFSNSLRGELLPVSVAV
jgi:tRNA-2-methylthio-N6-dimethylallyladenosine synthase